MAAPTEQNPYAAPKLEQTESDYYKTVVTRVTFAELWRMIDRGANGYVALVIVGAFKLLGVKLYGSEGSAYQRTRLVEIGELPTHVLDELIENRTACEACGFIAQFGVIMPMVGDAEGYNLIYSNRDGTVMGATTFARNRKTIATPVSVFSQTTDGLQISATSRRRMMNSRPGVESSFHEGANVPDLVAMHQARISKLAPGRLRTFDDAALRAYILENEAEMFRYMLQRRLLVPMTHEEVARILAQNPNTGHAS